MKILRITVTLATLLASEAVSQGKFTDYSKTCGQIIGQTSQDLKNLKKFCDGIQKSWSENIEGAYCMQSLLWIKINRELATFMQFRRLDGEQLVRLWIKHWKRATGRDVGVTIHLKWGDIEVAKGNSTYSFLSGIEDRVTIKQ